MVARAQEPHVVMALVEMDRLGNWRPLIEAEGLVFPQLRLAELQDLTVGVFQIRLARS